MEDVLFCPVCGSFRDLSKIQADQICCTQCNAKANLTQVSNVLKGVKHRAHMERSELLLSLYGKSRAAAGRADDAVIDEDCPKCKYPKLSFHTAQLRGVDEGQTIFYTCLNDQCGHKFTVNS